jgi:hypothetical protein
MLLPILIIMNIKVNFWVSVENLLNTNGTKLNLPLNQIKEELIVLEEIYPGTPFHESKNYL